VAADEFRDNGQLAARDLDVRLLRSGAEPFGDAT